MNRPHFRRHPRPVDPAPEYSRLDRLDGLGTRYDAEMPDVLAAEGGLALGRALDLAVFAPHSFVGGDLAAMAAPGDWPVWDYGEGYEIEPEERAVRYVGWDENTRAIANRIRARRAVANLPMVRAAATAYDLGLPVPLRSDPPIYRACLAEFAGAGVGA